MVAMKRELDYGLCREILLRLEELWEGGTPSLPRYYDFERHNVENVAYNTEKLWKAKLIMTTATQEWVGGKLNIWPTGFTNNGWRFLEVAKDEGRWARAIGVVEAQGGPESLRPLKAELFRQLA
ncbi:MAG: DUF2513 domain-containing protein [Caldilineaceae bacterium]|nr:DUF2513 domain-containing protein [Caldilineaceae bacterium]MDE0183379.1 DUF2513 domain-containing protein [Caldilineaceae bacterium]